MTPGLAIWKIAFEISPIVLVNGIAQGIPGQMLPIVAITEAAHLVTGLLSGTDNIDLDNFFARFRPLPGSTLIENDIGRYAFANQTVAANALISQPTSLSMLMYIPPRDELGAFLRLPTMTMLKSTLDQHNSLGGTYTIATPVYIYTSGILKRLADASTGESKHAQNAYQFDFEFPLLTLETAQQVQNSLITKLTNGGQFNGAPAWSGPDAAGSPSALASSSVVGTANVPAALAFGGAAP